MTTPNVLAVMDEMIDCYGSVEECQDDTEFLEAAREARAAVAELIDAVVLDAVDKAIASGLGASEWRAFLSPREAAALARVQGGAA